MDLMEFDTAEQINQCLNCEKEYCDNCLKDGRERFTDADYDFMRQTDMTDKEYAIHFGITLKQVNEMKRKIGRTEPKETWTDSEIAYLMSHTVKEAVLNLGKSKAACYQKKQRLERRVGI